MPFIELADIQEAEPVEGYHGRFVHAETMTVASWSIEANAVIPEHAHPHEQIACMLEGRFELTIDGDTQVLEPGSVAVIPSSAPHSGKALTACRIIDVWHPTRDDYRGNNE